MASGHPENCVSGGKSRVLKSSRELIKKPKSRKTARTTNPKSRLTTIAVQELNYGNVSNPLPYLGVTMLLAEISFVDHRPKGLALALKRKNTKTYISRPAISSIRCPSAIGKEAAVWPLCSPQCLYKQGKTRGTSR